MSEQLSHDPVVHALELERKIAHRLEEPTDAARKDVRASMEQWMELMDTPKVRKQYAEELGDLDPKHAEAEMLISIHKQFPGIAKNLGYTPDLEVQIQHEQEFEDHQLQHQYKQAA